MDWINQTWELLAPMVKAALAVVVWPMLWKWGKAQTIQSKLTDAQKITIKARDMLAWILDTYQEHNAVTNKATPTQTGPVLTSQVMRRLQTEAVDRLVADGVPWDVANRAVAGAAAEARTSGAVVVT
jgi:hypothetical protein